MTEEEERQQLHDLIVKDIKQLDALILSHELMAKQLEARAKRLSWLICSVTFLAILAWVYVVFTVIL